MPDLKTLQKTAITVEDLIQIKRCEAPSPEFWDTFDRELKAKTLQALVRPQPWYSKIRLTPAKMAISLIPAGATAAVVFMLVSVGSSTLSSTTAVAHSMPAKAVVAPVVAQAETPVVQPRINDDVLLAAAGASQFVMDEITTENDASSYRRVMDSETYRTSSRGAVYVADPFTRTAAVPIAAAGLAHF
ncbi:MAG: hypothetical protein SFY80_00925 [Verrucomicrobiota bacterium]|nr:hypothetical protein [Verrucomicrobiota bacterium]